MIVAIVNDNVVTEIKTINPEDYSSLICQIAVDITDSSPVPEVGWKFDGSKLIGTPTSSKITRLAMRQRFTTSEMLAIYTAAKTNVFFQLLLDNLSVATFIDLQRPDTIQGIMALVQSGILTAERANEILTKTPTYLEIYRG